MSNLIVNGDFEASNVTLVGWTTGGTGVGVQVGAGIGGSNAAVVFAASIFPTVDPNSGFIEQTVPTMIGTTYELTFFFSPRAIDSNSQVLLNGVEIFNELFLATTDYFQRTIFFTATTTSSTLRFTTQYGGNATYDDISLFALIICYSGESIVHTKNVETGEVGDILVKDLVAGKHLVFNTIDQEFIPVVYNVVNGPTERYVLVKKDSLGSNKPSADFYITSGHPILYNGIVTKAKNIPGVKRVKVKPEMVYSICVSVKDKVPILINNLDVMAWKKEQWEEIATKKNISWKNNKLE